MISQTAHGNKNNHQTTTAKYNTWRDEEKKHTKTGDNNKSGQGRWKSIVEEGRAARDRWHTLRLFVDWSGGATAVIEESAKKIFNLPGTRDLQVEDTWLQLMRTSLDWDWEGLGEEKMKMNEHWARWDVETSQGHPCNERRSIKLEIQSKRIPNSHRRKLLSCCGCKYYHAIISVSDFSLL